MKLKRERDKTVDQLNGKCCWCGKPSVISASALCLDIEKTDPVIYREACNEHRHLLLRWSNFEWTRMELYNDC